MIASPDKGKQWAIWFYYVLFLKWLKQLAHTVINIEKSNTEIILLSTQTVNLLALEQWSLRYYAIQVDDTT